MAADLELHVAAAPAADGAVQLTARLVVPPTHPLLAGHFPGAPLVAGVQLLEAACRALATALGRPCAIAAIDDVRWFQPVAPGAEVALAMRAASADDGQRCEGEWTGAGGRIAAFRMTVRTLPQRP